MLCSYQRRVVRFFSFNDLNQRATRVLVFLIAVISGLLGQIHRARETQAKPPGFTAMPHDVFAITSELFGPP
jgi:hypothetical protein